MNKYYYWLFIESFVYISIKNEKILLYNCLNGKSIEYNNNPPINILIKRLIRKDNLNVIGLVNKDLLNPEVNKFIKRLKEGFFGDIIDSRYSNSKPIQFMPIVNIQKNRDFLKRSRDLNVGYKMMTNLLELTIYINSECDLNCKICGDSYKQFQFCTKKPSGKKELDINHIRALIQDLKGTTIQKINILGGNIFKYSELNELNRLLEKYAPLTEYYIHYKNFNFFESINKKSTLNILVTPTIDTKIVMEINEFVVNKNIKKYFTFIAENINDFNSIQKLNSEIKLTDSNILPYYNGKNISFFRKYVFLSKADIIEAKPNQNDIFIRQNLNQNFFGKLNITSDGQVFSNLNNPPLMNIKKSSIYDAVYKEMANGKNWFKVRSKTEPCNNCLFNSLCPSISNYEYAIGKYNLCGVFPKKKMETRVN